MQHEQSYVSSSWREVEEALTAAPLRNIQPSGAASSNRDSLAVFLNTEEEARPWPAQASAATGPTVAASVQMSMITLFEAWRVMELKSHLDELELRVSGSKKQLIERLSEHSAGFAPQIEGRSTARGNGEERSEFSSTAQEMTCVFCSKTGHIPGIPWCPQWDARHSREQPGPRCPRCRALTIMDEDLMQWICANHNSTLRCKGRVAIDPSQSAHQQ